MGSGLQRIAKLHGGIVINGVHWVWDYVAGKAVPQTEIPVGSARWQASERAKYAPKQEVSRD